MPNEESGNTAELALDQFVGGVHYPHPFDRLAIALSATAVRHLCILSPDLDQRVFDQGELVSAVAALARGSRQTEVRILVSDPRQLVARSHRLLHLARRLPSSVRIHTLAEHPDWNGETVLTRDRDGVLYKPGGSDHEGFYEPNSRASTRQHLEHFEELWRHSAENVELRALSL